MADLKEFLTTSVKRANALTLEERKALCDVAFAMPTDEIFDVEFEYAEPLTIKANIKLIPEISVVHIVVRIPEDA